MKCIIYISLIIATASAADENINFQSEEEKISQYRPDVKVQPDSDSIVYGTEDVIAEQRNYQPPGFGTNYNLDNAQTDPYTIDFKYHDYEKMTRFLRETSSRFPALTALYSIGKSVQGWRSFNYIS